MFNHYHLQQIKEREEINSRGWNLCRVCRVQKPLAEFSRDGRTGRYNARCKKCRYATRGMRHYTETKHTPKRRFDTYKGMAKQRGHLFELTYSEFLVFWQKPCSYCGDSIKTIGIDRLDNTVGYTVENCVPCCETCNKMKRMQTKDEFLDRCHRIIAHADYVRRLHLCAG